MARKIEFDFDALAQKALSDMGGVLVGQGKANMDRLSHGRIYVIGGKVHIASKVGDSPNNMTGDLRGTIRYEVKGRTLEYGSGNGAVNYAKYLEKDRPNITKAIVQSELDISARVSKLFIDSLRVIND